MAVEVVGHDIEELQVPVDDSSGGWRQVEAVR